MALNGSVQNKVDQMCHQFTEKSLMLVLTEFPAKIREIEALKQEFEWSKLMKGLNSNFTWLEEFCQKWHNRAKTNKTSNGSEHRCCFLATTSLPLLFEAHPKGMLETNSFVHQLITRIRPYLVELVRLTTQVAFGVEILEPKLQEGNNFGVEVQSKTLDIVADIRHNTIAWQNFLSSYHENRSLILRSMVSSPQVEDYRRALHELDFHCLLTLHCRISSLYNSYVALHDFVSKNIDKVARPRD